MRDFALIVSPQATQEIIEATRWRLQNLGPGRALELEEALAGVFDRIQALPESGSPDKRRGRWSMTRRRVIVGTTGYILRYQVHVKAELVEVLSMRHQRRRPSRGGG
jgi:plasmid stabilization system protein ParE